MTEAERQEYLSRPHVGVISIAEEGRGPLTVPIWYDYEVGGLVKVLMHPDSRKAVAIAAAGRFSLCVQRERLPYKYVSVEGPVVSTEACDVEEDVRPMARRYLGDELGDQYVADGTDRTNIVIRMKPERWFSTDYGKTVD